MLYAPAWAAGWVRDVSGWLQKIQEQPFGDYLFRKGTRVQSLYPFTQLMLWAGYKLWGAHPLPWHLFMVTAHATVAWGWARFYVSALQPRWGIKVLWAGGAAGLFTLLSPYATEVVVWQAGFHYLQGSLLMLVSLGSALRLLQSGKKKWAVIAIAAFIPTLFALEAFVLTPFYTAVVALTAGREHAGNVRRLWRWLIVPMLLLCAVQYGLYRTLYNAPVPHIRSLHFSQAADWLRKPAKYFFHLFLWGRYWPVGIRQMVYALLNSHLFLGVLGLSATGFFIALFRRRRRISASVWVVPALFFAGALALVLPLYFHQAGWVYFDRYAYFMLPAAGALLGLFIQRLPVRRSLAVGLSALSVCTLVYTVQLWRQSDHLSRAMLESVPVPPAGRITLLLNVPNALHSIPMIGQTKEGEAALMRRYVLGKPFPGLLYEPSACNLLSVRDSVRVVRTGPQTLQVTALNGQGWWTGGVLSTDWENDFFAVHFLPAQSAYGLFLKQPAGRYQLLVWERGRWTAL